MSVEELVKELRSSDGWDRIPSNVLEQAADKLEELELHARHADAYLQSAQGSIQRAEAAEAALAEAKRENEALRGERDFLQEILDARPAINAALPESYIRWSQSLYSGEVARASLSARNAGGKNVE